MADEKNKLKNGLLIYYAGIACSILGMVTLMAILYQMWFERDTVLGLETSNLFMIISPFLLISIGGLGIFITIAGRHLMAGRAITWTTQIGDWSDEQLNKKVEKAVSHSSNADIETISKRFGITEEEVSGTVEELKQAGLLSKDIDWDQ